MFEIFYLSLGQITLGLGKEPVAALCSQRFGSWCSHLSGDQ